ncbi:MAG: hypothetical protein J5697_00410 [Clostridia bacterium]|nr:hypothetical protein [Clostridia bacterium]
MLEKLFGFMIEKKVKTNAAITFVRKDRRYYTEDRVIVKKAFKDENERAEFFKAVFYSRTHI